MQVQDNESTNHKGWVNNNEENGTESYLKNNCCMLLRGTVSRTDKIWQLIEWD